MDKVTAKLKEINETSDFIYFIFNIQKSKEYLQFFFSSLNTKLFSKFKEDSESSGSEDSSDDFDEY